MAVIVVILLAMAYALQSWIKSDWIYRVSGPISISSLYIYRTTQFTDLAIHVFLLFSIVGSRPRARSDVSGYEGSRFRCLLSTTTFPAQAADPPISESRQPRAGTPWWGWSTPRPRTRSKSGSRCYGATAADRTRRQSSSDTLDGRSFDRNVRTRAFMKI